MKRTASIFSLVFSLLCVLITGCRKDEVTAQEDNDLFIPRIFKETLLFPATTQILNIGQTVDFSGLSYSPADLAQISWKVNDKEVSTIKDYKFIPTEGGDFRVKLDVSYQGKTSSRFADFFVLPNSYTPKTYTNVMLSYLTENGSASNIDWNTVTHVAYKVATVTAAGVFDVSKGEVNRKADELVGRAHINGVPVLLGISGALSADGWSVSSSNNFGAVLTDVTKRAALVQSIKAYITLKKMDGVDVMMTDINSTTAIINANIAATGLFITELRAALGTQAIITATVTSNTYYSRYPDLSIANWVNVHAFEDGTHVGPGIALGQPSSYNYMVSSAALWKTKLPGAKLVIGIPAFGLRYNTLDANGNNLSWASYNYIPYSEILTAVPDAFDKEYANISKGVYFNGIPLVTQKGTYLKANGFLGAYIWAGDYDVKGAKSLTATLFSTLK